MKEVFVLWQDKTGYHYKQMTCFGLPTSTSPQDYGLSDSAHVILVQSNFRGANSYLEGNLITEAF